MLDNYKSPFYQRPLNALQTVWYIEDSGAVLVSGMDLDQHLNFPKSTKCSDWGYSPDHHHCRLEENRWFYMRQSKLIKKRIDSC